MGVRLQRFSGLRLALAGLLLALAMSSCSGPEPIPSPFRDPKLPVDRRVSDLMYRMRPDEKLALVRGVQTLSLQRNERLGIPALRAVQGGMGISARDQSGQPIFATAFPANIGMAATWNSSLMEQVGIVIAQQARALGRGQVLGPLADISHSPLSGRVFETYGEDPWLASRMVIGYISGVQGEGGIATAIFPGGPTDTRIARESDVRPIEAAVSESGVWAVMPRDGNPVRGFLNGLGFRGFTIPSGATESYAGKGQTLDEEVRGILRAIFASGIFDHEPTPVAGIETADHRLVARTAADQSLVLLKNDGGLLPFDKNKIHSIAVIGPNADANPMAGGSYTVAARYSATPLAALRTLYGADVFAAKSPGDAARADAAIVFAGTDSNTEGEGHDRTSLNLPAGQDELIQAVAKANPHTIVVLNSGSAVAMDKWLNRVPAVLEAWFPGEEGGNAIVDVLSGGVNASGRLPITFSAALPFGYGLSYTQFDYSGLTVMPPNALPGQLVEVSVAVRNTGSRAGKETVQLYLHEMDSTAAAQKLSGWQQISLNPGEAKRVAFTLNESATSHFDEKQQDWIQDHASFEVRVGSSSRDIRATGALSIRE